MQHKRHQIAKAILSQKSNSGIITISYFKLYSRAIPIKNSMLIPQEQTENQWNLIEDPTHKYSQLIFDAQNMHWKKDSLFNKWCWENWISTGRRLKLDPSLSPCTSINSKWTKDLNVRSETVKLI
jgi:hypothetical protein